MTGTLSGLLQVQLTVTFAPAWAEAYNGQQGDPWDAQKDMAMAGLGALIAMTVTLLVNRRWQRDFNREWAASLEVKQ